MTSSEGQTAFHALLIGVDHYLPNRVNGGGFYPSLGGCVRDVQRVEDLLKRRFGVPSASIDVLTATNDGNGQLVEPPERRATYANMVRGLQAVAQKTKPGDVVYIHYSGHGGRTTTLWPELKGTAGLDEALVPTDIGNREAQYLRDVELHHLLRAIVDRRPRLTVVLDSCHSGSATRGEARARGIGTTDLTSRPGAVITPLAALSASWTASVRPATRSVAASPSWLLEPQGYVLFSACRESEAAYEFALESGGRGGALTNALLDAIGELGLDASCEALHRVILARVHGRFAAQTPQLQGERSRTLVGEYRPEPAPMATVLAVDSDRVRIDLGQIHGIRKGAIVAIFRRTGPLADTPVAKAEVIDLGAVESQATVFDRVGPIDVTAPVRVLRRGANPLENRVFVLDDTPHAARLRETIASAVAKSGEGWLRVTSDPSAADLVVGSAVLEGTKEERLEIFDSAGLRLKLHAASISSTMTGAEDLLVRRLVHLARYRNVRDLENRSPMSPLAGKLAVDFSGWQADYDPADSPEPRPFEATGVARVKVGQWVFLRIRNLLEPTSVNDPERILNITVLDLQPDWGISQIFPTGAASFSPIDPGRELTLPLRVSLPDRISGGTDILKVFASTDTTSFRLLEMGAIGDSELRAARSAIDTPNALKTDIEALLDAIAVTSPRTRQTVSPPTPSDRWTTCAVELEVER